MQCNVSIKVHKKFINKHETNNYHSKMQYSETIINRRVNRTGKNTSDIVLHRNKPENLLKNVSLLHSRISINRLDFLT